MATAQKYFLYIPIDVTRIVKQNNRISWDKINKLWYVTTLEAYNNLDEYHIVYFDVKYKDKELAKRCGLRWDPKNKAWFGSLFICNRCMENSMVEIEDFDMRSELTYSPMPL